MTPAPEPVNSSDFLDVERLRDLESCVTEALPVLPVLCRQLTESSAHVERSVNQVCDNFQTIADKSRESVSRATQGLIDSAQDGRGVRQLSNAAAATIAHLLCRAEEAHSQLNMLAGRVEAIENDVQRIQGIARQVDTLSGSLRILSLNARIEAARFAEAGAAFGVVASETGKVAKDATDMNRQIQDVTGRLGRDIREIAGEIRERVAGGQQEVETARLEVEQTLNLLSETSEGLHETVQAAARDAEQVSKMIGQAVIALQFQDAVSQRISHAVTALRQVEEEISQHLSVSPTVGEEWKRRLQSQFTMVAEHEALSHLITGRTSSIELF